MSVVPELCRKYQKVPGMITQGVRRLWLSLTVAMPIKDDEMKDSGGKQRLCWYFMLYMTIGNTVVVDTYVWGKVEMGELTTIMIYRVVKITIQFQGTAPLYHCNRLQWESQNISRTQAEKIQSV